MYRVEGEKYFPSPALSIFLSEGPSVIHFCLQGKTGFPSFRYGLSSQRAKFGAGLVCDIGHNVSGQVKTGLGLHN